jgi:hypothetical protein
MRTVVLLCGPPGSGKTTWAKASGLEVYDFDDPQWTSERQFRRAISRLRFDGEAQAVVIRSGATRSAREGAAALIGATRTLVLDPGAEVCVGRVRARGRGWPSLDRQVAAVHDWYGRFEPSVYPPRLGW